MRPACLGIIILNDVPIAIIDLLDAQRFRNVAFYANQNTDYRQATTR